MKIGGPVDAGATRRTARRSNDVSAEAGPYARREVLHGCSDFTDHVPRAGFPHLVSYGYSETRSYRFSDMPAPRLPAEAARPPRPSAPAQAARPGSTAQAADNSPRQDRALGDSFAERARELVTFLAESRSDPRAVRRREEHLAEWIDQWQRASRACPGREQHFVAEELGIIVRALSGPAPAARLAGDNEALRWVIARCMTTADRAAQT